MKNKPIFYLILLVCGFMSFFMPTMILAQDDIEANATSESTTNAHDGSINLKVNGGIEPFTYEWTGPSGFSATTEDIENLAPGQYCVTVTDNFCGTATLCTIVEKCDPITGVWANIPCAGGTGNIGISLQGHPPYKINWNNGTQDQANSNYFVKSGLGAGYYSFTVTNASGCTEKASAILTNNGVPMQVNGNITQPMCGNQKGAIQLVVTGGSSPFTYKWSDDVSTKDRTNLSAATYCVTVTDKNGCTKSNCFVINNAPPSITMQVKSIKNVSNCTEGSCNGAIDIEVSNGMSPYKYTWTGPSGFNSMQQDITGLCKGTYTVVVRDNAGCTATNSWIICCCNGASNTPGSCYPFSLDFTINGSVSQISNGTLGSISTSLTGGSPVPHYYSWTGPNGFTSQSTQLSNLAKGLYCVTVTNGCVEKTKCFNVVNCDESGLSLSGNVAPTCPGYVVGSVTLTVSGGQQPYTYAWNNGSFSKNLSSLLPGTYCVTVSDANKCTVTGCYTVILNQLTIVNEGCTQYTMCGKEVVKTQEFAKNWVFNPFDCRFARIECDNGYIGSWINVGTEYTYPFGAEGCQIDEVCKNGEVIMSYFGTKMTDIAQGIDECGLPVCTYISYCYYAELGGYDPNSITPEGQGVIDQEFANCGVFNCSCGGGKCCCWKYYCDGTYIGTGEGECPAFTGSGGDTHKLNTGMPSLEDMQKQILALHPEIKGSLADLKSKERGNLNEYPDLGTLNLPFRLVNAYPNPFSNKFSVELHLWKDEILNFDVFDVNGVNVFFDEKKLTKGANSISILINSDLPNGTYLLRVMDENGRFSTKNLVKI
jgi:hypothetical protein